MTDSEVVRVRASAYHGVVVGRYHWGRPILLCVVGGRTVRISFQSYDDAMDCRCSLLYWLVSREGELNAAVLDRCQLTRYPLLSAVAASLRQALRSFLRCFES